VVFFLHIATRQVYLAGMTVRPDSAWVAKQARNTALHFAEKGYRPTHVLIDHDTKFVPEFDRVMQAKGVQVRRMGPCAPNLNPYAERWVQSVHRGASTTSSSSVSATCATWSESTSPISTGNVPTKRWATSR
jgi:putative transposase